MASIFSNISPRAYTFSAFILADILVDGLSVDEQNTLGNWLDLVAQTIITNAGQEELIQNIQDDDNKNIDIKG